MLHPGCSRRTCLWVVLLCLLLTGCASPGASAGKCTVLFEDDPALFFYRQVYDIDRDSDLTVSVGVPTGHRITGVGYERCSVSARTGTSQSYDYYTVTLHRVRYSAVVRLTTAPAYTTIYHGSGGTGETLTVQEDSPHLFTNTLPWRGQFVREGFLPIGWNTAPDGSGQHIGFGSRIDRRDAQTLHLYLEWLPCTAPTAFTYEQTAEGAAITGYTGSGPLVIPDMLDGAPVTALRAGAFGDLAAETVALPPTLKTVEPGAFASLTAGDLYLFDTLEDVSDASFGSYAVERLHMGAVRDPVYSGSYFDTLPDKLDALAAAQQEKKLVLFCGSSARFGYDSPRIEAAFPDYKVLDLGVYAYSGMLPQAMLVLSYMKEGDVLLHSPELDAIDTQFCGETRLDKELFCMVEANYDLLTRLDMTQFTGVFDAFAAYQASRQGMSPRAYAQSASQYDEDGNRVEGPAYNAAGDYILFRENNTARRSFGVKRAYYNPAHIRESDWQGLQRVYGAMAEKGVTVFFTYSPRSSISLSPDSTTESIAALDAALRARLGVPVISTIESSLMDPLYFYATDNHLSTEGVALHTQQVIEDLYAAGLR